MLATALSRHIVPFLKVRFGLGFHMSRPKNMTDDGFLLELCPLDRREADLVLVGTAHAVRCTVCGCTGPLAGSRQSATQAWNRRIETGPIADPITAIRDYMTRNQLEPEDLIPIITTTGGLAQVWRVLNRKKALTLRMIRELNRKTGIPTEILCQEYPVAEADRLDGE